MTNSATGLRSLLGYGLPMTVVALAGTIAFQFDRIVVGTSFSPHDFAIYALGAVEVPLFLLVGQAVTNVLLPALAQHWQTGDRAGMIALWRRSMRKMGVILFPSFVFLMIMADDVSPSAIRPRVRGKRRRLPDLSLS